MEYSLYNKPLVLRTPAGYESAYYELSLLRTKSLVPWNTPCITNPWYCELQLATNTLITNYRYYEKPQGNDERPTKEPRENPERMRCYQPSNYGKLDGNDGRPTRELIKQRYHRIEISIL